MLDSMPPYPEKNKIKSGAMVYPFNIYVYASFQFFMMFREVKVLQIDREAIPYIHW